MIKMKNKIISLFLSVIMLVGIMVCAAPSAAAADATTTLEGTELYSWSFEILNLLNKDRVRNGQKPLVMDAKLMEYATQRAFELYFLFDHSRPNGNESPYSICPDLAGKDWMGENISMKGYAVSDPARVNTRLYESPGHRANMLEPHFSCVGIGAVYIEPWVYVCELFGGPNVNTKTVTASQYKDRVTVRQVVSGTSKGSFVDVPLNSYYFDAVEWAVQNKITNGTDKTHFSPDANCTRSQIVTFLWRSNGSPEPTETKNPFKDVKKNDYYYKAVLWAVENNITKGTSETTFSPNDTCTRADALTFLWRFKQSPVATSSTKFKDVPKDAYYTDAVNWGVANNITQGTSKTTFSPDATCSRSQIVTFLYRTSKVA